MHARTAIGSFGGTLKSVPASTLGAIAVKEAIKRAGITPEMVEEVIMGNVPSGRSRTERSKTDFDGSWNS